jgi:hypothetical protein
MAVVHNTTMNPTKLALLAAWLPGQPWYTGTGRTPDLGRAGGFRLDDPHGEVGIEFMAVTDQSGDRAASYLVPMTYRANAIDELASALIGTSEHGVLGRRWIYDGAADPVLVAELVALIQGEVRAQAQSVSNTPDTTVTSTPVSGSRLSVSGAPVLSASESATEILLRATAAEGDGGDLVVRIIRLLSPGSEPPAPAEGRGSVSASWRLPDGAQARGMFAEAWIR